MCKHVAYTSIQLVSIDQYHFQLYFISKAKIRVFSYDEVVMDEDIKFFAEFANFYSKNGPTKLITDLLRGGYAQVPAC